MTRMKDRIEDPIRIDQFKVLSDPLHPVFHPRHPRAIASHAGSPSAATSHNSRCSPTNGRRRMRLQSLAALGLMLLGAVGLYGITRPALPAAKDDPKPAAASKPLEPACCPASGKDGFVQLPNQWRLKPAGRQIEVGDFPVNIAIHPTGQFAAVLMRVQGTRGRRRRPEPGGARGSCRGRRSTRRSTGWRSRPTAGSSTPAAASSTSSTSSTSTRGIWSRRRSLDVSGGKAERRTVVGRRQSTRTGRDLFAASLWGDAVVRVPLDNPDNKVVIPLMRGRRRRSREGRAAEPAGRPQGAEEGRAEEGRRPPTSRQFYPYACLPEPGGKRAFVSLWAKAGVAVIDLEKNAVVATWPTAEHPTEMVLSPEGKALYVACANSTKVSVLDPATGKRLQTIVCALYPQAPTGNTPNSLALTPDGEMLFVANADANNLAVFNVADRKNAKPLGLHPDRLVPDLGAFNPKDKRIYVANGKGLTSQAKPQRAEPAAAAGPQPERVHRRALPRHARHHRRCRRPRRWRRTRSTAYACSPLAGRQRRARPDGVEPDNPIPREARRPEPDQALHLHHQGEPHLRSGVRRHEGGQRRAGTLPVPRDDHAEPPQAGPRVRAARQLLRRRRGVGRRPRVVDGGLRHRLRREDLAAELPRQPGKTFGYPARGTRTPIARPAGGYLWDRCTEAKVSYRSYGEWVENGKKNADGTSRTASRPSRPWKGTSTRSSAATTSTTPT